MPESFLPPAAPARQGAPAAVVSAAAAGAGLLALLLAPALARADVLVPTAPEAGASGYETVPAPPPPADPVARTTSTRPAPSAPLPLALPAKAGQQPLENPAPAGDNAPANSRTTTPPTTATTARVLPPTTPGGEPVLLTPRRVQLGCSLRDYGAPVDRGQVAAAVFNTCSGVSLHKPMFLTIGQSPEYNGKQSEVVFQLSGKGQVWDFGPTKLYAAYTQETFLQLFDSAKSRRIRENLYNPEIFLRTSVPFPKQLPNTSFDLGFEHQSNGKDLPDSRSFNRVYIQPYVIQGRQAVSLKLWYRIPENENRARTDPNRDDNPDINRYLGYGELHYRRDFDWRNTLVDVGARFNPASGKGALMVDYSFTVGETAAFFVRGFTGYGDSLIDYNHYVTRATVGVALQR